MGASQVEMQTSASIHRHTYIRTCMHTYINSYIHVLPCVYTLCKHIYILTSFYLCHSTMHITTVECHRTAYFRKLVMGEERPKRGRSPAPSGSHHLELNTMIVAQLILCFQTHTRTNIHVRIYASILGVGGSITTDFGMGLVRSP